MVNPAEMNISLNELSHHGILGMKWYVRRFQKYPAGYTGDGKYVGPDGEPRKATRKEKKAEMNYHKIRSALDKGIHEAVEDGDKKKLKVLKPTMTNEEYKAKYKEMVDKNVSRAVRIGDVKGLKKFKPDLTPNDYKDAKSLLKFNEAVNNLDTEKMNKQISKIKNDDLKAATERIATMTELQKKKVEALKVESDTAARLAKAATTVGTIADLTTKGVTIYENINKFKSKMNENKKSREKDADETKQKMIKDAINSGDPKKIAPFRSQMTIKQIEEANQKIIMDKKPEITKAFAKGDYNVIARPDIAPYLNSNQIDELAKTAKLLRGATDDEKKK